MRQYTAETLLIKPNQSSDPQILTSITPQQAGWEYVSFEVRRFAPGERWSKDAGASEYALVMLGGAINVASSRGDWHGIGGREHVFAGPPHALYLPRDTSFEIRAVTACEVAIASAPAEVDLAPRLVTPADVALEIRGGDNATRQINSILPPGFPCQRLVIVEVYTPGGSWSSYPPHKHDVHRVAADGAVLEADLEEIYFYKFDRPEGFAYQRVYTDENSPLQQAGFPIDAVILARNNDTVLVPEGYHPVVAPPGYNAYYLNVLAGSAQSLANVDDPHYSWVKDLYRGRDPRVPLYPM